ncbi:MAG: N-6 DNA methylase [Pyramidobacter sp.]|nr:N-6 DNA methylase [Pyramidobacter sp.]
MDKELRKSTGSFYTSNSIAGYISKWAIRDAAMTVLEPSFGDGTFLKAAIDRFAALGCASPSICGVELQREPFNRFMSSNALVSGYQMDFLDFPRERKVDAVIGNPPYVRLNSLDAAEKRKAISLMRSYGVEMPSSGSLWMPFLIHSTELLREGGCLGFVLPYEITYVRYAFRLWQFLAKRYGKLRLCRVYEDFFPDVDVETIVFLAEQKGGRTDVVEYGAYETERDLWHDKSLYAAPVSISDILEMKKPFERNLLPDRLGALLDNMRRDHLLEPLKNTCKFNICYVCGNKKFFHPAPETAQEFAISPQNLKNCLLNSKDLSGVDGLDAQNVKNARSIFYPTVLRSGDLRYIEHGEQEGVNRAYKCRVRNPWYMTPGLKIPDVILTVFGDVPKLLANSGRYYVSNSLLAGTIFDGSSRELLCSWYNSLTLLQIEINVHSLGGGSLVLIPGETDRIEIVASFPPKETERIYSALSERAKNAQAEAVYECGDELVLKQIYGISDGDIAVIREALATLRAWRRPETRRRG